jgi:hypothetical protein
MLSDGGNEAAAAAADTDVVVSYSLIIDTFL